MAWMVLGRSTLSDNCPLSVRNTGGLILEALLSHEHKTGESRLRSSHPLWEPYVSHAMGTYMMYLPGDVDPPTLVTVPSTETSISFATSSVPDPTTTTTTTTATTSSSSSSKSNQSIDSTSKQIDSTKSLVGIKHPSLYARVILDDLSVKIERALACCVDSYSKLSSDLPSMA